MTQIDSSSHSPSYQSPSYQYLKVRVNVYQLTAQAPVDLPRSLIYFHGFSQHDGNFALPKALQAQLVFQVTQALGDEVQSQGQQAGIEQPQARNNPGAFSQLDWLQQLLQAQAKLLVTVSIDSSEQGLPLSAVVGYFDRLKENGADLAAFSYGTLIAQAYRQELEVGRECLQARREYKQLAPASQQATFAQPANSAQPAAALQPADSAQPAAALQPADSALPAAAKQLADSAQPAAAQQPADSKKSAHPDFHRTLLICGSLFPFGKLSINERVAKRTLELWDQASLVAFGELMGFGEREMAPLRAAMEAGISTEKQKQQLLYFHKSLEAFTSVPDAAQASWTYIYSRRGDRFYSLASQQALAELVKPAVHQIEDGPHYVSPQEMVALLAQA